MENEPLRDLGTNVEGYSHAFAKIIQQNKAMLDSIYDFRNFM